MNYLVSPVFWEKYAESIILRMLPGVKWEPGKIMKIGAEQPVEFVQTHQKSNSTAGGIRFYPSATGGFLQITASKPIIHSELWKITGISPKGAKL